MSELKTINEVRHDHRDSFNGNYMIDVYLTDDEDEQGFVAATVDKDGKVEWKKAHLLEGFDLTPVHEAIKEAIVEQRREKKVLVEKVLVQILKDIDTGDLEAIEELLYFVQSDCLVGYLPSGD